MKLRFIDPSNCGCTDCLVGEAVPLSRATKRHLAQLVTGELRARFSAEVTVSISVTLDSDDLRDIGVPRTHKQFGVTNLIHEAQRWDGSVHIEVYEA